MAGELTPAIIGAFRHLSLGDVISTNTECMDRARSGEPGGLWITAGRQLGGRGRRGRPWISEPGNLYASLLLIDPAPGKYLASLPLAAAIGVHEAVSICLPAEGQVAEIKWPNDILVGGKKTAGILIEGEVLPNGRRAVVIGCGINVALSPQTGLYPATCLAECGSPVSPQELFARLFSAMAAALADWDGGRGISTVRSEWLARAGGLGKEISVRLADREIRGVFEGIDAEGRLELAARDGQKHCIAAGDVFFPVSD